jgi:sugar lactone lactonase YvrE
LPEKINWGMHPEFRVVILLILHASIFNFAHSQPTILVQPAGRMVWAGSNVKLSAGTSGTGTVTYQWLFNSTNIPSGVITVAGNGSDGFSGDGGAATNASLNYPNFVTSDNYGNLFVVDQQNIRIRKVDTNEVITTVAGGGTNFADNIPATNADLNAVSAAAVDNAGNIYIVGGYVVRKVDTNGIITTVAGNGTFGHSGAGGAATNASLYYTSGVAVDKNGGLYFSDSTDREDGPIGDVYQVDLNGILTIIAGNGTNKYSNSGVATNISLARPFGIGIDDSRNIFIADNYQERIFKLDTNGLISTVAGTGVRGFSGDAGVATNAQLNFPAGCALDRAQNLFFADTGNNRIREVDTNGIIRTVAGNGLTGYSGDGDTATNTILDDPYGIAIDSNGDWFIADTDDQRIREVNNPPWPNSQKTSLLLNNVSMSNAGNYQELVTDDYGSITSNIAVLTVVTNPSIYQTAFSANIVTFNSVSPPGSTNVVFYTTNLIPPIIWQVLSTNLAGADGDWQFLDSNPANSSDKFYRFLKQ